MVGDDAPMQICRAAIRALLANRPARRAKVEIVGISHAASSVSLGERLGRQDLIQSQIQRSRARVALHAISHNVYYVISARVVIQLEGRQGIVTYRAKNRLSD